MTTPVIHGFPDWNRSADRAAKLYTINTGVNVNAQTVYGPFFVGDQTHLAVVLNIDINKMTLSLSYYDDENGTTLLGVQVLSVSAAAGYDQSLPVLGPWVQASILPSAGTISTVFWLYAVAGPILKLLPDENSNILVSKVDFSVATGVTNFDASRVWPGEAWFYAEMPATLSEARVESVDVAGTTTFIARVRGTNVNQGFQIFLPSCPVRIRIGNTAVGNQNYTFALVARPLVTGG